MVLVTVEKIKWLEEVTNEVLELVGKSRTFINNVLRRKVNWVGHILRRNFLLHEATLGPSLRL